MEEIMDTQTSPNSSQANTLPAGLKMLAGEILDVDSHEMMPAQVWVQEYGSIANDLAEEWLNNGQDVSTNPNHPNVPGYVKDDAPIELDTIWQRKGSRAPGAVDIARRTDVMNLMGVKRQLMFPTGVGMYGVFLVTLEKDRSFAPTLRENRKAYGRALINAYNKWGMKIARLTDRVRPTLPVVADTVDELIATSRGLIDNGIRAIWLPSGIPPGGKSPAHSDLDPFWKLMTDHNMTVCLHLGADRVYASDQWGNAPVFEGFRLLEELKVDPWSLANAHVATQNFLTTAVVGGVFERHPSLRFGAIEAGAYWVGPMCDAMDLWYGNSKLFGTEGAYRLPQKPSDYVRRNVRVSGFDFEPLDKYVKQYGLEDVLCFASDYPHIEGGKDPVGRWYKLLQPLGPEVVEKFFIKNGQWLLPE
jgi:hypothetical protein